MSPEIYIEFSLVFDNDFDVNIITHLTGIMPTECRKRKDNRLNPLSNRLNEGFWTIKSNTFNSNDVKGALDDIVSVLNPHVCLVTNICQEHGGEVIFDIVVSFPSTKTPAVYFDREFLELVQKLRATIQLDMYVED